jgi:hypothetical protein
VLNTWNWTEQRKLRKGQRDVNATRGILASQSSHSWVAVLHPGQVHLKQHELLTLNHYGRIDAPDVFYSHVLSFPAIPGPVSLCGIAEKHSSKLTHGHTHWRWCEELIKRKFPRCAPADLITNCLLEIGDVSWKLRLPVPLVCSRLWLVKNISAIYHYLGQILALDKACVCCLIQLLVDTRIAFVSWICLQVCFWWRNDTF